MHGTETTDRPSAAPHARVTGARRTRVLGAVAALACGGCAGPQSALDPGGRGAEQLAELFWILLAGSAAIWLGSVTVWVWASYASRRPVDEARARRWIVIGGVVLPVLLLGGVLAYSLRTLPDFLAPAPEGSLRVRVVGYQYWWRVQYPDSAGAVVELANEVRLPAGEPVQLELESRDVIHSLWIPALGGKMDMIPGRRTRLRLDPVEPGVYRGACAELCGVSHALMAISVVVQEPEEFRAWLARQARPAVTPSPGSEEERGGEVFLASGCGACHRVRGTPADGTLGPDLTHVGSRISLAAGTLPNETEAFRRFVAETAEVKPGVHMPAFGMLGATDLDALAAYLKGLL